MSGPYGQPGYNPQYQNPPYGANVPPPAGWAQSGRQQQFVPPPHHGMMMGGAGPAYAEEGKGGDFNLQFNDRTVRAAFIRKVFALVTVMLLVVAVMTVIPFLINDVRVFLRRNLKLYFAAYIFFVVYMLLVFCESVRRSFPANLIFTAVFTLSVGFMTMMRSAHHDGITLLLALFICTICCASVVVFASQTKYDLTKKLLIIVVISECLLFFGIIAAASLMTSQDMFLYNIYALLASILFMVHLAIDIQMIMGGRNCEISPEDHVYAAIQIFLDIVYTFRMLSNLIGSCR